MEDAQGRLVFRAQMFIHNDIQNYQAKPEDFENINKKSVALNKETDKLKSSVVLNATTATLNIDEDRSSDTHSINSVRSNLLADGNDDSCGWFPTLQKTLWLLSKLYRCVQVSLFRWHSLIYILTHPIKDRCV